MAKFVTAFLPEHKSILLKEKTIGLKLLGEAVKKKVGFNSSSKDLCELPNIYKNNSKFTLKFVLLPDR